LRAKAALGILAATLAALASIAPAAAASPPPPADLEVVGGEDTWHAENQFELTWTNPSTAGGPPLAAVHYRVRDQLGIAIAETRIGWATSGIAALTTPRAPGTYTAEVWLEDSTGAQGPAATARLRFDDARPGSIRPLPLKGWIGRTAFPFTVHLSHPASPTPRSGIRGYAVAIDRAPGGAPCAAADRCKDSETTLHGGIDDDSLAIAALPDGSSYLHAVAVSGSGMKSVTSGQALLRVDTTDPVTQLAGAPGGWVNHPVTLTATATDAGSGMEPDGEGPPPFAAIRVDGGAPKIELGASSTETVIGEGSHLIAYYARDAAGNVDDGGDGNGIPNRQPRTALVLIDRTAPTVAFANAQDPSDPERIRVRIADPLAGPDSSRGWIGVRAVESGDRFERLPASPSKPGELNARWESDSYPAGEYEFRAIGYDGAGNATSTRHRANGTTMVLSSPLKGTTALRAGLGDGALLRTVRYGRGTRLGGRLTTGRGTPIGGMPVRIVERFADGASPTRTSTVKTAPNGEFSIHLTPGPSREVAVAFDGSPTLSRSTAHPVELRVRGGVRLRASSTSAAIGGAPLVFRGQVASIRGAIPAEGKAVQLQFRLPGLPWTEFRTIQTDRRGRFRYAYRFSDDDSRGVRFQFRAYAPAQEDWPYEPGGSRPVLVLGR
jgi:hypothetical protein